MPLPFSPPVRPRASAVRPGELAFKLTGLIAALLVAATILAQTRPALADPVRLLALGDSLTHGYGLPDGDTFPDQLEAALTELGYEVEVLNGGVSGDTTAGGRARLEWALADGPDAVLLELGANDMLRGLDPAQARTNLAAIVERLQEDDVPVMLAGMYAARNLDDTYAAQFDAIYPDLAETYGLTLYPFFLEGVAMDPALNQPDGLHPNADGVAVIVDNITPVVVEFLADSGLIPRPGG